jgi:WD40 repeat protein
MPSVNRRRRGRIATQKIAAVQLDEAVVALQFLQGSRMVALTAAGSVWLYEGSTGKCERIGQHAHGGLTLAVQPGGAVIATGGQDGRICLWSAGDRRRTASLETDATWVERIVWNPDGSRLAATIGRRVGVWNACGELLGFSGEHASTVADIAWQPDGERIATAAYGGVAYLNAVGAGPTDHVAMKGSSLLLSWQPQGNYLACGNQEATVLFVLVEAGTALQMWGFPSKVRAMSWSENGHYFATASGSGVVLWDASGAGPRGRTPLVMEGHFGFVTTVAWQPKGRCVASGGTDGQACLYAPPARWTSDADPTDPPTIEPEDSLRLNDEATALTWTPGGGMLAVGDRSGTVSIARVS